MSDFCPIEGKSHLFLKKDAFGISSGTKDQITYFQHKDVSNGLQTSS